MIKQLIKDTYAYHTTGASAVFKLFIAVVLFQFALLSIASISNGISDIPILESHIASSHFWWGLFGLLGSFSLVFENYIKNDKAMLSFGYISAITSFILLSYDFVSRKPPIHTGGILSVTAGIFLGGILYGKLTRE
jgi:hypothetical protein